jgi:phosphoglycolate phosphatase
MRNQLRALVFDLDGTLTDSKPGIVDCLRTVLRARNLDPGGPLDRFVGPPVDAWTVELLPDATEADRAALALDYRNCYDREGWKNNSVFAGLREMLRHLREQEFSLYICTSKQQNFAQRILDAFELTELFTAIYGDKQERASHGKVDLLSTLLNEWSIQKESAWMIGDRIFDIQAAHANNIPCLAAGWGYGAIEEFTQADAIAAIPADVPALVSAFRTHPPCLNDVFQVRHRAPQSWAF